MGTFHEITPSELKKTPFEMIGKDWMLVTAGNREKVNTMTASWGGLGVMWGKDVAFAVIRPQRYTKEFIDREETVSLSFYGEAFKKQLGVLGSVSGRDRDKIAECGLTTVFEGDTPYFEEAETVLICRKKFAQEFTREAILDAEIVDKWYPEEDFHTLYILEIEKVLVK
jgi:flavin reductase (DIM6/NTAB) family NADH-FMN oxidoreductase RutF